MADIFKMMNQVKEKSAKRKKFSRGRRPDRPNTPKELGEGTVGNAAPEGAVKKTSVDPIPECQKSEKLALKAIKPIITVSKVKSSGDSKGKSKGTVREQNGNSKGTVREQNSNRTGTVKEQYSNGTGTVQEQTGNSRGTVGEQKGNSKGTVREHPLNPKKEKEKKNRNSTGTVREQYENSTGTVPEQSGNSTGSKGEQYELNKGTEQEQSGNSTSLKAVTEQKQNRNTFTHQIIPLSEDPRSIETAVEIMQSLSSTRLDLLKFICEESIKNDINSIHKISYPFLANLVGKPIESVKTIFKRLKRLDLFTVESRLKGPGATINIYPYPSTLKAYSKLMIDQSNYQKVGEQSGNSTGLYTGTPAPSSSSKINLEQLTTTTTYELPESFAKIEIPPTLKDIRFSVRQIEQIAKKEQLSAEDLVDSLEHFAYDLQAGNVTARTGPLNFLMGVLIKRGMPYISEEYVTTLRKEKDNNEKLILEYRKLRKQDAQDALTQRFNDYFGKLSAKKINQLAPPNQLIKAGSISQKMIIREMFKNGELSPSEET